MSNKKFMDEVIENETDAGKKKGEEEWVEKTQKYGYQPKYLKSN